MHLNCMVSMYISVGTRGGIEAMPSDFIKCGQMVYVWTKIVHQNRCPKTFQLGIESLLAICWEFNRQEEWETWTQLECLLGCPY